LDYLLQDHDAVPQAHGAAAIASEIAAWSMARTFSTNYRCEVLQLVRRRHVECRDRRGRSLAAHQQQQRPKIYFN
jgi:hypothetical protein